MTYVYFQGMSMTTADSHWSASLLEVDYVCMLTLNLFHVQELSLHHAKEKLKATKQSQEGMVRVAL